MSKDRVTSASAPLNFQEANPGHLSRGVHFSHTPLLFHRQSSASSGDSVQMLCQNQTLTIQDYFYTFIKLLELLGILEK